MSHVTRYGLNMPGNASISVTWKSTIVSSVHSPHWHESVICREARSLIVFFAESTTHRHRSSVNFVGRHFFSKICVWKITNMPEFYMIIARTFLTFFFLGGGGGTCPCQPTPFHTPRPICRHQWHCDSDTGSVTKYTDFRQILPILLMYTSQLVSYSSRAAEIALNIANRNSRITAERPLALCDRTGNKI